MTDLTEREKALLALLDKFRTASLAATVACLRDGEKATQRILECVEDYRNLVQKMSNSEL